MKSPWNALQQATAEFKSLVRLTPMPAVVLMTGLACDRLVDAAAIDGLDFDSAGIPLASIYFRLKRAIPLRVRRAIRRLHARRLRSRFRSSWPIDEASSRRPAARPGWPAGKELAFVLTHDIDGTTGLVRRHRLAQNEPN